MKTSTTASIVIALAALAAGQAMAADASAAIRSGADVVEPATGQKLGDLFPALYGKTSSKTRAEVTAAVERAVSNNGDVIEPSTGLKLSVVNPAAYAPQTSVVSRADVRAQAVQALSAHNAGDVVEPTTGQKLNVLFASRYNGKAYN